MVIRPQDLFTPIAPRYGLPAAVLSLGGYGRWRRALVRSMALDERVRALDVATGTGLVARDLRARFGCEVVGLDLTEAMLHAGPGHAVLAADAVRLPFEDAAFGALTFSYLLRYVEDPADALRELARVVAPGGRIGSVEFGVPRAAFARAGWRAYARGVFPSACRAFGPGWRAVGSFLPGSIETWARDWPIQRQIEAWRAAGISDIRARSMMLGTGDVIVGRRDG